jgi:centrin-1
VNDLEEDLTDQQILQLICGANDKSLEDRDDKDKDRKEQELVVTEAQFVKILSCELNEDKKK